MKLRSGTNTSTMLGYKSAKAGETHVVITLEIPKDAITNISRKDIMNVETAKHRTNKATVVKIEDELGYEYIYAESLSYKQKLIYVVNKTIVIDDYDMDLDKVCSTGIHFFLTRRCAELYGSNVTGDGVSEIWYDNGQKHMEYTYDMNRNINGVYRVWYRNGQKSEETTYVDGKKHGRYQTWNKNGIRTKSVNYVNDRMDGLYQKWHDNGQLEEEIMYVNGKLNGVYKTWYSNGTKQIEATYLDGKPVGVYRTWSSDGKIVKSYMYEDEEDYMYEDD